MKVFMFMDADGWMNTRLSAEPDGTDKGAEIVIRVNPSHPNSFLEYVDISRVFTVPFMEHLNIVSDRLIKDLVATHPDIAEEASMDIFDAARLAGFSLTEAQDLATVVLLDEGRTAG